MGERTKWKVLESPCPPEEGAARWEAARARGATGAVTSRGSGIRHRETIRLFWEVEKKGAPPLPPEVEALAEDLIEEDWTPYWKEALVPFRVAERVLLTPAWEAGSEAKGEMRLRIDPGMAFGAGDHPTTRLMVAHLLGLAEARRLPGAVLDVGAGTGVLSLVAARLGAGAVEALDIDPFCYASCRRNIALNGLADHVRPLLLSLDLAHGRYPLVLANIVAGQLEALLPDLRERTAPGGLLLLSGFTAKDEERVAGAARGFRVRERSEEEGWVALLLG